MNIEKMKAFAQAQRESEESTEIRPAPKPAEFFASGEPLTSDSVDKITSEVFGYLYNQEQHSRLSYNNPTEIIAPEQPAEQFTLFGDNEFTMEEPPVDELPDESLNRAAAYIKDYFEQEFGSASEIEDPSHVDLAYTTDEENDAVISVYADLVQYRITTEYGGNIAREVLCECNSHKNAETNRIRTPPCDRRGAGHTCSLQRLGRHCRRIRQH